MDADDYNANAVRDESVSVNIFFNDRSPLPVYSGFARKGAALMASSRVSVILLKLVNKTLLSK